MQGQPVRPLGVLVHMQIGGVNRQPTAPDTGLFRSNGSPFVGRTHRKRVKVANREGALRQSPSGVKSDGRHRSAFLKVPTRERGRSDVIATGLGWASVVWTRRI